MNVCTCTNAGIGTYTGMDTSAGKIKIGSYIEANHGDRLWKND